MSDKRVLHFVRKFLPFTYTFVRNQIGNHINYDPFIVLKELVTPEIHANYLLKRYPHLDLSETPGLFNKLLYNYLRKLTWNDFTLIDHFIEKNGIQIMHFHFGTDAGMYYRIMKTHKIPSVVSFYGYDCSSFPNSYMGYGKTYLNERVFKFATKILAMSPDMKNDLLKIGCPENKIIIHYHGIEVNKFYDSTRKYFHKENINLLILSSLSHYKGHHFLLEAIRKLVIEGKRNFHLTITGKGILENELKKTVTAFGLDNYVTFYGYVKYGSPEMRGLLKKADVFVHPSITYKTVKEGIPGAIIEAMASGLPVISTYHAGIPSIIESGMSGILVKEFEVSQLANAINQLIDSVELRENYGKTAQQYALSDLNLNEKEKELEEIYDSLL